MIVRLEGQSGASVEQTRARLDALARDWGHQLAVDQAESPQPREGERGIDPVAVSALVVSIPSAMLAVADLADRIAKRRRAAVLIDEARAVKSHVTVLVLTPQPVELASLAPDQLLEIATDKT